MRYAQGGGLTAERQQARERIRFEAGERFVQGEKYVVIAKDLRVSGRSVERWRRVWRVGGMEALASSGSVKVPKLSDERFADRMPQHQLSRPPSVVDGFLLQPLRQRDGMDAELDRGLRGLLAGATNAMARARNSGG
ncbi:helix-turn-helix domain-containing protein [Streptomyces sp. NBC_00006]|uniref:helix-turn-helix domain-containing protein n=1 Tax=Streptomyces sp. NBC_00006 TaxID=2975619 RepID=UPI0022528947|nr:helix-turn-helix domain-containing protein [Streptomyces sp. NBC_00006]MCX5529693.1 helix-turn-helix domain-containing protein [Streptomyces sp. NBC_00006]